MEYVSGSGTQQSEYTSERSATRSSGVTYNSSSPSPGNMSSTTALTRVSTSGYSNLTRTTQTASPLPLTVQKTRTMANGSNLTIYSGTSGEGKTYILRRYSGLTSSKSGVHYTYEDYDAHGIYMSGNKISQYNLTQTSIKSRALTSRYATRYAGAGIISSIRSWKTAVRTAVSSYTSTSGYSSRTAVTVYSQSALTRSSISGYTGKSSSSNSSSYTESVLTTRSSSYESSGWN